MNSHDAIVVGAGHNGLACAAYLAKAGWDILVLERNREVGGAVRSGQITRPGFTHDLYATNQNLFRTSPVYRDFKQDLERHGLRYIISDKPYANAFPNGKTLRVYRNAQRTLELIRRHSAADAEVWEQLYETHKAFGQTLAPLFGMPLPSVRAGLQVLRAARQLGWRELLQLMRIAMGSTRELGEEYATTPELRAVFAAWSMHLDFGPDVATGAIFPLLECFADMELGIGVAQGGASHMPEALAALVREAGGTVRTEVEVRRVLTSSNRATGVELASGERIEARRAVIANLTPAVLFGRLLESTALPESFRRQMASYRYGPGTMMIHLALSGVPPWQAGEDLAEFAYVHIGPYVEDLAQTYVDSLAGRLPASPLLVVGQTSAIDPSRAPGSGQVLWIQVRTVPSRIQGDAKGEIHASTWADAKEPFADRVMNKLEAYAPGIKDLVLNRVAYSPEDLEHSNPNLVGGDSVSGSHHLRQNFVFRPAPGWSRYRMPIEGLYMVGAATWPGAGTHGTSGYLAAQMLLHPSDLRSRAVQLSTSLGSALASGGRVVLDRALRR